jgi:hypothetical protein
MTSYSASPKRYDETKAYLYFEEQINPIFNSKNDNTLRVLLLVSLNNDYVEGSAQVLNLCGQTIRNHLKQLDPQELLQINQQTIKEIKKQRSTQ